MASKSPSGGERDSNTKQSRTFKRSSSRWRRFAYRDSVLTSSRRLNVRHRLRVQNSWGQADHPGRGDLLRESASEANPEIIQYGFPVGSIKTGRLPYVLKTTPIDRLGQELYHSGAGAVAERQALGTSTEVEGVLHAVEAPVVRAPDMAVPRATPAAVVNPTDVTSLRAPTRRSRWTLSPTTATTPFSLELLRTRPATLRCSAAGPTIPPRARPAPCQPVPSPEPPARSGHPFTPSPSLVFAQNVRSPP